VAVGVREQVEHAWVLRGGGIVDAGASRVGSCTLKLLRDRLNIRSSMLRTPLF